MYQPAGVGWQHYYNLPMSWFEHRHYWRPRTGINTVSNAKGETVMCLVLEECSCGEVRTIEYQAGQPPIVRMGLHVGSRP
jgi:hypothetical protein